MTTGLSDRIDLVRAGIGLFVVLGVVLTGVGGYAVLSATGIDLSADLAVSLLSGVSLVAFAAVLTVWLRGQTGRRRSRRSA